jgi:hypothetical protein
MKYDQLLQLYFERSTALQNYWTLYVVVIGGLLAISNLRLRRDLLTVVLVTVLYSFFAYKNLGAIHDVTSQREATVTAIKTYDANALSSDQLATRSLLEPTLVHPEYDGIHNFHVICDVLVIVLLWAMERRRAKIAREHERAIDA